MCMERKEIFTLIMISDECYLYLELMLDSQCLSWYFITCSWVIFIVCGSPYLFIFFCMIMEWKEEGVVTYRQVGLVLQRSRLYFPVSESILITEGHNTSKNGPLIDWLINLCLKLHLSKILLSTVCQTIFGNWRKKWIKRVKFLSFQDRPTSSQNIFQCPQTTNGGSPE